MVSLTLIKTRNDRILTRRRRSQRWVPRADLSEAEQRVVADWMP